MTDGRLRERLDDGADRAVRSRLGRGLARLGMLIVMLVSLPLRGTRYLLGQARGTWLNLNRGWNYLTFDNILPPSLTGLGQWIIETTPKLLGLRNTKPWQQVAAALSVIGVALLATFLTGGFLIATVIIVAALGSIGIARHIPDANEKWNEWTAALPIKNDYDVPRWRRD